MPRKAGSNIFHCTSCMVKDFGLADIHEDRHKTVVERTGTMPFTPLEFVENMGKGDVLPHIYGVFCFVHSWVPIYSAGADLLSAFDAESLAYVTLWVTARYDEGRLVESTEPALSKWINKTTTPKMLTALRKKGLYGPKATSSHHAFLSVYFYFYHAVGGNTFMIKDLRHIYLQRAPSYERRKPDDLFDHFTQYIDYALQQIGHLTEVERAQQQIKLESPVQRCYRMPARWG